MSLNSIGISSADRIYTKSKFSLIVIDVYYVYCGLIILCAKNVSLVILFGEIICKGTSLSFLLTPLQFAKSSPSNHSLIHWIAFQSTSSNITFPGYYTLTLKELITDKELKQVFVPFSLLVSVYPSHSWVMGWSLEEMMLLKGDVKPCCLMVLVWIWRELNLVSKSGSTAN